MDGSGGFRSGIASGKSWYTAADLAALALPGLPKTKRKINELAADRRWALQVDRAGAPLSRARAGRGGGVEYHVSLLPPSAMTELAKRGHFSPEPEPAPTNLVTLHAPTVVAPSQIWSWYDRQTDKVKAEAQRRLRAIDALEAIERTGVTRTAAVASVAGQHGVSAATLWNWLGLIAGVPSPDRLPKLAPNRQGGGAEVEIHPVAWQAFKSDYLRPSKPTLAACYERLKAWAKAEGVTLPCLKTFQRRMEREVPATVIISKRFGDDALRRTLPPQQRSIADLHALELVNIDGHRFDVFVKFPARNGEPEVIQRPILVGLQDVYSRKFLAWRVGRTESAVLTRLAFADLFTRYGIPDGCLLDNGRAFASKWITGGSATRYRFKIREEDPQGLLTSLGVQITWAKPFRGQSKPIERGFRDFCEAISKHPAFEGAYTGNSPAAKPENYGARAIDLDVFLRVVGRGIEAHNAKLGRRTEAARGASFDQAFEQSYRVSPIRKATPEQLRLALLAAERLFADRQSGTITLHDNRFWTPELVEVAGQRVIARFDPDNLTTEVHVYRMDGSFLATAPCIQASGFQDFDAAKARARQEAELRKVTRRQVELENLLSADQLAALMPDDEPEGATPQATVIRPVKVGRGRGSGHAAAAKRAPIIDRLDLDDLAPASGPRPRLRLVE